MKLADEGQINRWKTISPKIRQALLWINWKRFFY